MPAWVLEIAYHQRGYEGCREFSKSRVSARFMPFRQIIHPFGDVN